MAYGKSIYIIYGGSSDKALLNLTIFPIRNKRKYTNFQNVKNKMQKEDKENKRIFMENLTTTKHVDTILKQLLSIHFWEKSTLPENIMC